MLILARQSFRMHAPSDAEIIQQVLQGHSHAYSKLVDQYQNMVFTLAFRYTSVREEAEEIAQDVFVKAYRSLSSFNGKSKFSTWLYTIAHRTAISRLRLKKESLLSLDNDEGHTIQFASDDAADKRLHQQSDQKALQLAMSKLQPVDARIITLFYQADQSLDEIAFILGMTANNVKVRLFRARQKLRELLKSTYESTYSSRPKFEMP